MIAKISIYKAMILKVAYSPVLQCSYNILVGKITFNQKVTVETQSQFLCQ